VLDDLDRAEKHGDLTEGSPFTAIAQKLRAGVERIGLTAVGTVGDPFDPTVHEAIFQKPNPEVTVQTVADVVESGYFIGETLLRAAKVVVDTPADG
jgi:molecular chaperone GrpE